MLWKLTGKEIILLGDFNNNVYTACYAKRLQMDNLSLLEQCLKTNGIQLPGTFVTGTWQIGGCFVTSGVDCIHTRILPQFVGVDNHHCLVLDVTSALLIGDVFPDVVTAK